MHRDLHQVTCALACLVAVGALWAQDPPASTALPDGVVAAREAQLLTRLKQETDAPPVEGENAAARQRGLDELIADASKLVTLTTSDKLKYDCLSIQLQALNMRLTRWPGEPGNERRLAD